MRTTVIVKTDPVADDTCGVLDALEAVTVGALFFEGTDDPLDHAILLWAMRGDELLFQTIATNQSREVPACKNQAVVRAKKEFVLDAAKGAKPADQSVFQSRAGGGCFAGSGDVPAQKLSRVAIDDQGQRCPTVFSGPNAGQVRGPALVWSCGN